MKDIKGYEGLYAITSCGKVWSYRRKIFLKPTRNKGGKGYYQVLLQKQGNKECKFIHRLVMENYCPIEGMEKIEVDHIDFNIENNSLNNLRWLSPEENHKRQKRCKKVRCIETGVIYENISDAARQTGICRESIGKCCNGKMKTAGGYHWEYVIE